MAFNPRALLISLLSACVVAGVLVAVIGILKPGVLIPSHHGGTGEEAPPAGYVVVGSPPPLSQQREAFSADDCFDSFDLKWESRADGQIYVNDELFILKGLSFFGCEGRGLTFTGLNKTSIDTILDWSVQHGFNTLRIPFSAGFALADPSTKPKQEYVSEDLRGLSIFEIMDTVLYKAAERGLLIILDLHFLQPQMIAELWYDDVYSEADVLDAWRVMLKRYGKMWHLAGIDLKNEPNGHASWGDSNPATDVNKFFERLIMMVATEFPEFKGLFLVEGVQWTDAVKLTNKGDFPSWWGGNFENARDYPIDVPNQGAMERVVLAPHIYGPAVYKHPYMMGEDYKTQVNKAWDEQFGWMVTKLKHGVIVGEWGGHLDGRDGEVMAELSKWLLKNCMVGNIWWSLNPESGDVGGLMAYNWKSFDTVRMDLLSQLIPDPSEFRVVNSRLCYHRGTFPNKTCLVAAKKSTANTADATSPTLRGGMR